MHKHPAQRSPFWTVTDICKFSKTQPKVLFCHTNCRDIVVCHRIPHYNTHVVVRSWKDPFVLPINNNLPVQEQHTIFYFNFFDAHTNTSTTTHLCLLQDSPKMWTTPRKCPTGRIQPTVATNQSGWRDGVRNTFGYSLFLLSHANQKERVCGISTLGYHGYCYSRIWT